MPDIVKSDFLGTVDARRGRGLQVLEVAFRVNDSMVRPDLQFCILIFVVVVPI